MGLLDTVLPLLGGVLKAFLDGVWMGFLNGIVWMGFLDGVFGWQFLDGVFGWDVLDGVLGGVWVGLFGWVYG